MVRDTMSEPFIREERDFVALHLETSIPYIVARGSFASVTFQIPGGKELKTSPDTALQFAQNIIAIAERAKIDATELGLRECDYNWYLKEEEK